MLPAASVASLPAKPVQPVAQTALRTAQPPAPETARASIGEASAANVRAETPNAIQASEQVAVAPRLRDQENAERSERAAIPGKDAPTGPPPTFEESPLERQARVALDPPDPSSAPEPEKAPPAAVEDAVDAPKPDDAKPVKAEAPADPPPTPSERAEASFAETRTLGEQKEPAKLDLAR